MGFLNRVRSYPNGRLIGVVFREPAFLNIATLIMKLLVWASSLIKKLITRSLLNILFFRQSYIRRSQRRKPSKEVETRNRREVPESETLYHLHTNQARLDVRRQRQNQKGTSTQRNIPNRLWKKMRII